MICMGWSDFCDLNRANEMLRHTGGNLNKTFFALYKCRKKKIILLNVHYSWYLVRWPLIILWNKKYCETFTIVNCFTHCLQTRSRHNTTNTKSINYCCRCQGFWHTSSSCQNQMRCVRCGENHVVEYCPRNRSNPICCNCGGTHHAAYRFCPVRLQLLKSTQISFTLSRGKPDSGFYSLK